MTSTEQEIAPQVPLAFWHPRSARGIHTRVVVEGTLTLQTPAHFGNGDGAVDTDMPLLIDKTAGVPLLTGASIAGALRAYLGTLEDSKQVQLLFGQAKAKYENDDDEGLQSPLIVEDAYGTDFAIEPREGVMLDGSSRTAADKKLFNLDTWQAGTQFNLRFELVVSKDRKRKQVDAESLLNLLAKALSGFNDGSITLGARKQRGYGRVALTNVRHKTFDLHSVPSLLNWIEHGDAELKDGATTLTLPTAKRTSRFRIEATFALDGSLLIRGPGGDEPVQPDMVHMHSYRPDGKKRVPVLTGTSLAGALRARATRIARVFVPDKAADDFIDAMFGQTTHASHVRVEESVIDGGRTDLVQSRVAIDRFTGGALDTALFDEQPVFGNDDTTVQVNLDLRKPNEAEMGMLLLLLKDLWTGDLPIGGEISVGRGRLKGKTATLILPDREKPVELIRDGNDAGLQAIDDDVRKTLEGYVKALKTKLKGASDEPKDYE